MPPSEIPTFATSNLNSCEQYLFLNHPTTFMPLTPAPQDNRYHASATTDLTSRRLGPSVDGLQQQQGLTPTPLPTSATCIDMQRHPSSESNASANTENTSDTRHEATQTSPQQHHQNLLHLATLSSESKSRRIQAHPEQHTSAELETERQRQAWNIDVLSWWPLPLEVMEKEWSEEFYD